MPNIPTKHDADVKLEDIKMSTPRTTKENAHMHRKFDDFQKYRHMYALAEELERENNELRKDKDRMDFLEARSEGDFRRKGSLYMLKRKDIDKAMKQ